MTYGYGYGYLDVKSGRRDDELGGHDIWKFNWKVVAGGVRYGYGYLDMKLGRRDDELGGHDIRKFNWKVVAKCVRLQLPGCEAWPERWWTWRPSAPSWSPRAGWPGTRTGRSPARPVATKASKYVKLLNEKSQILRALQYSNVKLLNEKFQILTALQYSNIKLLNKKSQILSVTALDYSNSKRGPHNSLGVFIHAVKKAHTALTPSSIWLQEKH